MDETLTDPAVTATPEVATHIPEAFQPMASAESILLVIKRVRRRNLELAVSWDTVVVLVTTVQGRTAIAAPVLHKVA